MTVSYARFNNFPHVVLFATQALGKRPFKRYLDSFFPSLHAHLSVSAAGEEQRSAAAMDCTAAMKQFVGESIFEARVPEEYRNVILGGAHF